jgi:hypothetical protein
MVQMIKDIAEEIRKMIVALVEFDYEEAFEEMNKNTCQGYLRTVWPQ